MASAIRDLPETRASCCSNHLLTSSTRGLLCSWRTARRSKAVCPRRRVRPAPRPVVTGDGPEVSFLGAAAAGIEHWRHGLIDRDLARGQNEFAQPKIERLELGGRIAHPERQDRALDVEALREQHLGLPIER